MFRVCGVTRVGSRTVVCRNMGRAVSSQPGFVYSNNPGFAACKGDCTVGQLEELGIVYKLEAVLFDIVGQRKPRVGWFDDWWSSQQ
jgi:hypothetical protein